jgi:TRAP-type mannitol/chloroaromatic compound transport system substrate-binding protein
MNGRVKVTYFPGGTQVSANQTYDAVVKGIADIGFSVVVYTPGRQPLTSLLRWDKRETGK